MTAAPDTRLQINYKTPGGTLINLYATDAAELDAQLSALSDRVPTIFAVEQAVTAGGHLAQGQALAPAPAQPAQTQASPPPVVNTPPQAAPSGAQQGQFCQHGPRQYKEGTKKDGGTWKAWFCPSPKGTPDQCEPVWVR